MIYLKITSSQKAKINTYSIRYQYDWDISIAEFVIPNKNHMNKDTPTNVSGSIKNLNILVFIKSIIIKYCYTL